MEVVTLGSSRCLGLWWADEQESRRGEGGRRKNNLVKAQVSLALGVKLRWAPMVGFGSLRHVEKKTGLCQIRCCRPIKPSGHRRPYLPMPADQVLHNRAEIMSPHNEPGSCCVPDTMFDTREKRERGGRRYHDESDGSCRKQTKKRRLERWEMRPNGASLAYQLKSEFDWGPVTPIHPHVLSRRQKRDPAG